MCAAIDRHVVTHGLVRSAVGPVLVLLLLTLAVVSLAPAVGGLPGHGPDAQSSLPHRGADSPLSAEDAATRLVEPLFAGRPPAWVPAEPYQLIGLLASRTPFHPPRSS